MKDKSIVIAKNSSGWIDYLVSEGKVDFVKWTNKRAEASIESKLKNLSNAYAFMKYLIVNRKTINDYQSLILVGNNLCFMGLLLNKLKILKNEKVVWWGFYLHSEFAMKLYGFLGKMLESNRVVYVLYSNFEKTLYKSVLSSRVTIHSLPFGSWNDSIVQESEEEDYYFSGGYSNRDYIPLIEAFRETKYKLVIIASKLNVELNNIDMPNNVTLLRDVNKEIFHETMLKSRGVIIPLKHNLGSSGQMVMINAMARKKVIVINDNDIMKEYIEDKLSGVIVDDMRQNIIETIEMIENDEVYRESLKENSFKGYVEKYSRNACRNNTEKIISEIQSEIGGLINEKA